MTRVINLACAVLFAGTTLCALVLSASSTLSKAQVVGVPAGAVWSAVGVLELVSLAGTLRWLTATTARGRLHAVLVVGAVALVTGVAGWASYGWFGLVAPLAVVGTIHMIVETLADLPSAVATSQGDEEVPAPAEADGTGEGWGPAATATAPPPRPRVVPPVSPAAPSRPAVRHVDGWTEDMACVARGDLTANDWVRARAKHTGVTQSGKSRKQLRVDVETVELARAATTEDMTA